MKYDLEIEDNHNFFANDILVHNSVGNDITDKIIYTNYDKPDDDIVGITSLKCEAFFGLQHQKDYDKNIRNVVAGILNQKEIDIEALKKIEVSCFEYLEAKTFLGTPKYSELEELFNKWKESYTDYNTGSRVEIDGLVIKSMNGEYENNDELLPDNIVAVKFNKEGVDAEIGNIEWNIGKHGRLTPVLILKEAVEIDGTSVQRVSASNFGIVQEAGLHVGAKVKIHLSGDIIPQIIEIITPVFMIVTNSHKDSPD